MYSEQEGFYIYLNSLSDIVEYPENSVARFTNKMSPPLHLSGSYNVGLENIFINTDFDIWINKGEERYSITISKTEDNDNVSLIKYSPTKELKASSLTELVELFQADFTSFMSNNTSPTPNHDVKYKFNDLAAGLLGLQKNVFLSDIRGTMGTPKFESKIPQIYVYSDIVSLSRVGSQQTNLLDILPINGTYSKNSRSTLYKSVKHNILESISIELSDHIGNLIPFKDGTNTTCILHFKRV